MLEGMGMRPWMFWILWILHCEIPQILSSILTVLILKFDIYSSKIPMMEKSSGSLIFVFMLLHSFTATATVFLCGSLLSRYEFCALISLLFWYGQSFALFFVAYDKPFTDYYLKKLVMLLPNVCVILAILVMIQYEHIDGATWSNIQHPVVSLNTHPSIGCILLFLTVDILLYFFIAWYFTKIMIQGYNIREVWNFLFTKPYWQKICFNNNLESVPQENIHLLPDVLTIEPKPIAKKAIIQIRNLSKSYGEKRSVVSNINVDFYENEITIILGQTKAGKSTLINIITGKS